MGLSRKEKELVVYLKKYYDYISKFDGVKFLKSNCYCSIKEAVSAWCAYNKELDY